MRLITPKSPALLQPSIPASALPACVGKDNLPGYADATVDFNAACFPTDTLGNANTIAGNASRCVNVWKGILLQAPSITTSGSGVDFAATAQGNRCTYTYRGDTSTTRRFVYNSATGQIAITNP